MKTNSFEDWYYYNKNIIPTMFGSLIQIAKEYNINIFDTDKSYKQFVHMLYSHSSGDVEYDSMVS